MLTIIWLTQAVVAFYLYQKAWRYEEDLTAGMALLFVFLSLIPVVGLIAALGILAFMFCEKHKLVIWKKYD